MTARLLRTLPEPRTEADARRSAQLELGQDLAARYAQLAGLELRPRPVDRVLRLLDIVLASTLLVPAAPVMGVAALAIRLTSGSPVLYRGARARRRAAPSRPAGPVSYTHLTLPTTPYV